MNTGRTHFKKGLTPWNKGLSYTFEKTNPNKKCLECKMSYYAAPWMIKEGSKYCSRKCFRKAWTKQIPGWNKGTKGVMKANKTSFTSEMTKGEKNVNWKGGVTSEDKKLRTSPQYEKWRTAVFIKDNYTCVWCKEKGGRLEADHIKPWSLFPELRFDVKNGRTLCKLCHKKTATYLNPYLKQHHFSGITGDFSLMINEFPVPEVRDEGKGYEMRNDGSIECEVGEFLYGLVRLVKPNNILETGCYKGWSSAYMGAALKENKYGHIETLEIDENHIKSSKELWNKLELNEWITATQIKSLDFEPKTDYQILFLDSEPHLRFHELVKFYNNLKPGGFVFMHDLHHHLGQETIPDHEPYWPWGEMPKEMKEWITTGQLKPWYFPNPRGMSGFQKKKEGDWF